MFEAIKKALSAQGDKHPLEGAPVVQIKTKDGTIYKDYTEMPYPGEVLKYHRGRDGTEWVLAIDEGYDPPKEIRRFNVGHLQEITWYPYEPTPFDKVPG